MLKNVKAYLYYAKTIKGNVFLVINPRDKVYVVSGFCNKCKKESQYAFKHNEIGNGMITIKCNHCEEGWNNPETMFLKDILRKE